MRGTGLILAGIVFAMGNALAQSPKLAGGPITAVAFSPNGKTLAVGRLRTTVLFDVGSGRELAQWKGSAGAVTGLAFSPDGKTLAAAGGTPGRSGEIVLWDVATGRKKQTLTGHSDVLYGVTFSPNGKRLVAGSYDRLLSLWNLTETNPAPRMLKDHTDAVYAVAISPDGTRIASVAGDRTLKIWDMQSGKRLFTFSESTAELYSVAFRPDGKQVAAGGADKILRVWNLTSNGGSLASAAFAHQAAILRVAYAPDGKTLLSSGEDNAVKCWDAVTLAEHQTFPRQPDWPQALALDPQGNRLAIGRHDGSLALYSVATGKQTRTLGKTTHVAEKSSSRRDGLDRQHSHFCRTPLLASLPAQDVVNRRKDGKKIIGKGGPTLFMASLGSTSPTGARRGQTVRFTLFGGLISDATGVYFDAPTITGKIVAPPDTNRGILGVDVTLTPNTRLGIHRVFVQTPHGTTGSVTFAVGDLPEIALSAKSVPSLSLPTTLLGTLEKPGELHACKFDAKAGEEIVFEVVAQPLRSRLQPVLLLRDATGRTLAESAMLPGRPDMLMGYYFTQAGTYTLQLRDYLNQSGGDVTYRLNIGAFPYVTKVFPTGLQKGTTAEIEIAGFNLGGRKTLTVQAPATAEWGQTVPLRLPGSERDVLGGTLLAVGNDPEMRQTAGNESRTKAQRVSLPVTINGRLFAGSTAKGELSHYYRFTAKKGERLILETVARRRGSLLDPTIAVLDSQGRPVERAVLRAVGQTEVTLSDRDSSSTGIRLVAWDDFHINDYLMIGREVIRILALPKGPDDDVAFRSHRGQRLGYLGTTPEFHSISAPAYKVEIHPPGSRFSSNGMPLTSVYYQNDDGGPLHGKDSYLEFMAPADGDYIVRLSDARGQQGEEFTYRLLLHPPRPDFRVTLSPAHPGIPQGGGAVLSVECDRYDGFDGPIAVRLEGLPAGIKATETVIEAGEMSASLLLMATEQAVTPSPASTASLRLVAEAKTEGTTRIVHTIEPENRVRLLTLLPKPDLIMSTNLQKVILRPGEETTVEVEADRQNNFGGRIPVEVRNLPAGVRVQDVGLNGVLITELETSRKFVLYCEPWVKPQQRPIYVLGVVEGGVSVGAAPLVLQIEKRQTATLRPRSLRFK